MACRDLIQFLSDTWSGVGHKKAMEQVDRQVVWTWVGNHWRRLTAYKIFQATYQNRARAFLSVEDDETKRKHREYGDASLLVNVVRSAVTGDDISIVIEGMQELPPEGEPLPDGMTAEDVATGRAQQERLEELERWTRDERLRAKVLETERDAVRLGDGIYVLGFDAERRRVRLRLYDPGFYFPVLDPSAPEDEYPSTVHIAFEQERTIAGKTETLIHRITWTLGPINPEIDGGTRSYPWNDKPSTVTCYMTEGLWRLEDLKDGATIDMWEAWGRASEYMRDGQGQEIRGLDLQLDFIPVVHIPNSVAIKEHFGESILLAVAQALDELAAADTDAAAAAALAGLPMVGASGMTLGADEKMSVTPGQLIGLGPDGKLQPLDLSASLSAVMTYIESLLDRITVNARVTSEALGRVKASEVPSGLALALSFGPMRSLIEELRLVRAEKYPILLRFVQRMSIAQRWMEMPVQPATLAFGSFLPTDRASVIEAVTKLYAAHLISRHTAIRWLVDEGVVDVDVAEELNRCEEEDFAAALALFDALGNDEAARAEVRERLGIKALAQRQPGDPVLSLNGGPATT